MFRNTLDRWGTGDRGRMRGEVRDEEVGETEETIPGSLCRRAQMRLGKEVDPSSSGRETSVEGVEEVKKRVEELLRKGLEG